MRPQKGESMKRLLLMIGIMIASGCAVTAQRAAVMSNYDLCNKIAAPLVGTESKYYCEKEIIKRGVDCTPYWQQRNINVMQSMELMRLGNEIMKPQPTCYSFCNAFGQCWWQCR